MSTAHCPVGDYSAKREPTEMRTTVPVDANTAQIWTEARYGLGLFSRPCGDLHFRHALCDVP